MFSTYGAHQVSSVTELRTDTTELIDHAETTGEAILLQRNNEPVAILLSIDTYAHYLTLERDCKKSASE